MVSIEFYSVHGGFPVDPEHVDSEAVVQKHEAGMPIKKLQYPRLCLPLFRG